MNKMQTKLCYEHPMLNDLYGIRLKSARVLNLNYFRIFSKH